MLKELMLREAADLRAKADAIDPDRWEFFSSQIPKDYRFTQTPGQGTGYSVHKRSLSFWLHVDTFTEAIAFAAYFNRCAVSILSNMGSKAVVPATVNDYFSGVDPDRLERVVYGSACIKAEISAHSQGSNSLEFFVVRDDRSDADWVKVEVRVRRNYRFLRADRQIPSGVAHDIRKSPVWGHLIGIQTYGNKFKYLNGNSGSQPYEGNMTAIYALTMHTDIEALEELDLTVEPEMPR